MPGQSPDATHSTPQPTNYYTVLGLRHTASVQEIRRAYRDLSKLYHPDTTELPPDVATAKFHTLNEAYATLSNPERRAVYDLKQGYSRVSVIQTPANFNRPVSEARRHRSNTYFDPSDRPLSAGELFALFILGITFVACLLLVLAVGVSRGEFTIASLKSERLAEIIHQATVHPAASSPDVSSPEPVDVPQDTVSNETME
ncbi:J domain-containing protein [Thermoleptolyngbya sp.]